jgi:small-conductance mechanosensitive channel
MKPQLTSRQWLTAIGLALLLLAAVVGAFLTRNAAIQTPGTVAHRAPVVDERPLQTARNMAKLSATWDEQRLANQALRAGDHEVDLAFSDALRDAANHPAPATPQTQAMFTRLNKAQETLKRDQGQVDQLKAQLAAAKGGRQDAIQGQLDLAQAQVELDEDDVDGARTDLIRSGADKLSRVQRQFKNHEDADHAASTTQGPAGPTAMPIDYQASSLLGQIKAWRALQVKRGQLQSALDQAGEVANALTLAHDNLEKELAPKSPATAQSAATAENPGQAAATHPSETAIAAMKVLSDDRKNLADLSKRMQDMQEVQTAYGNWIVLVHAHQMAAVHGMLTSALWIFLIMLALYITDQLVDRYLIKMSAERTRLHTLRTVIRFAFQVLGVLLVLLVILGTPQQLPTILGFAGAGLTVALKDFIVGFFGWFVLMGKNGLRVGDWVEIEGVVGEVIEINLLRTVLLETGNWTTTGHPTGRKVAFVNSYAIEGHFFNFTTTGQWLWDELRIPVPFSLDPSLVDAIQKTVEKETAENVEAAGREWERVASHYKVQSVSANPAVNLYPGPSGMELHVRYITRAHDRSQARGRLNQAVMQLLHGRDSQARAVDMRS